MSTTKQEENPVAKRHGRGVNDNSNLRLEKPGWEAAYAREDANSFLEVYGNYLDHDKNGDQEIASGNYGEESPTMEKYLEFLDRDHWGDEGVVTPHWRQEPVDEPAMTASVWLIIWG